LSETGFSEPDINRVNEFTDQLLLKSLERSGSVITAEGLILNFIDRNTPRIKNEFKKNLFFSRFETSRLMELICENLYAKVSGSVYPVINNFIDDTDFSFFDRISRSGTVSDKFRKEKLYNLFGIVFRNRSSRLQLNSVINIFKYNALERYIGRIFNKRDLLCDKFLNDLKADLSADELIVFFKTMLMVKNIVFMNPPVISVNSQPELSVKDAVKNSDDIQIYTDLLAEHITPLLPGIPENLIRSAVKSNFNSEMNGYDDTSAALIFILCSRFHNYRHIEPVPEGAEPADKSWFYAASENAGHFGYDREILDTLYKIAGENNW
jgi:hypothetical protein